VEDPGRLDGVGRLGLDETSFLKATRRAPTRYVTGLVDLEGGRLLDVVADRTRAAVDRWLGARPHDFTNYRLWLLLHCGVRWQTHPDREAARPLTAAATGACLSVDQLVQLATDAGSPPADRGLGCA
jgi:hypothetical protein